MASRALPDEDVSAVANCLCWCAHARDDGMNAGVVTRLSAALLARARSDTYFVMVMDTLAPRSALRGTQGGAEGEDKEEARDEVLETMQRRARGQDFGWLFPCPTCMALVHGMDGEHAARDADLEAVLTVRTLQ